jgi:hypothetical protein
MEELQLRKEEIQVEINGYRGTPGYKEDQRIRLLHEAAILKRENIDLQMTLIDTTNEEERKDLRGQIQTKEQQIQTNEQLILRLLPQQQMQVVKQGNLIFLSHFVSSYSFIPDNVNELLSAIRELIPALNDFTKELRMRRGVEERGSSYDPTPQASGDETPTEETIAVKGINSAKRYAELFHKCVKEHNSDCNLVYNQFDCTLKQHDQVVFRCSFDKASVKNAYALFRVNCSDNINVFLQYLSSHNNTVPDFDGEAPIGD